MRLTVTQAFTLVATSDVAGRPLGPQRLVCFGVAGAALIDLGMAGRIALDPQRGDRIAVVSADPVGDLVLDGVLRTLSGSPTDLWVSSWIRHLGTRGLRDRVLAQLVGADLLVHDPRRTLGVSPASRFVGSGRRPEGEVVAAMAHALAGGDLDADTACLILLCDGARVLGKVVDGVPLDVLAGLDGRRELPPVAARVAGVVRRLRSARVLPDPVAPAPRAPLPRRPPGVDPLQTTSEGSPS